MANFEVILGSICMSWTINVSYFISFWLFCWYYMDTMKVYQKFLFYIMYTLCHNMQIRKIASFVLISREMNLGYNIKKKENLSIRSFYIQDGHRRGIGNCILQAYCICIVIYWCNGVRAHKRMPFARLWNLLAWKIVWKYMRKSTSWLKKRVRACNKMF